MAGEKAELTTEERDIFNREWDSFVALHYPERDFVDIFEDNKEQILEALGIAKWQLELEFGGIDCDTNQIGWTPIQPNFLLTANAVPAYSTNTWKKRYTTDDVVNSGAGTYVDWIGSSASNRLLSKYATMIVIGFSDPVETPKVSAIKASIKNKEYPIWYIGEAMLAGRANDMHVYELPKPHVIEKEQPLYLKVKVASAGDDELRPIGVYYARGDHLRDTTAYSKI